MFMNQTMPCWQCNILFQAIVTNLSARHTPYNVSYNFQFTETVFGFLDYIRFLESLSVTGSEKFDEDKSVLKSFSVFYLQTVTDRMLLFFFNVCLYLVSIANLVA